MAWTDGAGHTRLKFGVCGNFRYGLFDLTDVKATRSLVEPSPIKHVFFAASTNETDAADVFAAKTLNWTGTADANEVNQLTDTSEVFDKVLTDHFVSATSGASDGAIAVIGYSDADTLDLFTPVGRVASDIFPAGTETFTIDTERVVQVIAASANDDGTLLVLGR